MTIKYTTEWEKSTKKWKVLSHVTPSMSSFLSRKHITTFTNFVSYVEDEEAGKALINRLKKLSL